MLAVCRGEALYSFGGRDWDWLKNGLVSFFWKAGQNLNPFRHLSYRGESYIIPGNQRWCDTDFASIHYISAFFLQDVQNLN